MQFVATRRSRGFVLVFFALALVVLLGAAGLMLDVGRMYITRSEEQAYCDAAAIAAALKLDGTAGGIANARAAALAIQKRWNFGTVQFDDPALRVEFAKTSSGPWQENPAAPAGYVAAKVTATLGVPMLLMPVLTNRYSSTVVAGAIAKQIGIPTMSTIFPFGPLWMPPDASSVPANSVEVPNDPYGMVPARLGTEGAYTYQQGGIYSLRGPASIKTDKNGLPENMCANDLTILGLHYREALDNSDRGYVWTTNSADDIRDAILGNETPVGESISVGDSVVNDCDFCLVPGAKQTEIDAIQARVGPGKHNRPSGDSDYTSPNYAQYVANNDGNGQRVVVVPIITGLCGLLPGGETVTCPGGYGSYTVIGFAGFFLLPAAEYSNHDSICAEYIGPWVPNQAAGGGGGAFDVKLVR